MNIFEDRQFIRLLDHWLANNDQTYAQQLSLYKTKVPNMFTKYNGPLYRGMVVPESFMNDIQTGKAPQHSAKFSSWTKDKDIAVRFAKDQKYKTNNKVGIPILLTLTNHISYVVMDINAICLFVGHNMLTMGLDDLSLDSAIKEQEVLLQNVKLTKSMIRKL